MHCIILDKHVRGNLSVFYQLATLLLSAMVLVLLFIPKSQAQIAPNTCSKFDGEKIELNQYFEQKRFPALASYLNGLAHIHVTSNSSERRGTSNILKLNANERFIVMGRFKALVFSGPQLEICAKENTIFLTSANAPLSKMIIIGREAYDAIDPNLSFLKYYHLWLPLAYLSRAVEAALVAIKYSLFNNWGAAIISLALFVQIFTLPLSIWAVHLRNVVASKRDKIDPQLDLIKQNFDGEEAHNKIMSVYKSESVSPFYTMKPMIPTLLQIPILIAVFNALGEMHQLANQSFWLVENLVYQDNIIRLPFELPLIGNVINLLPVIMLLTTTIPFLTDRIFNRQVAQHAEGGKQTLVVSFLLFLLFYPFPSSMILYWTSSSFFQFVANKFIREYYEKKTV